MLGFDDFQKFWYNGESRKDGSPCSYVIIKEKITEENDEIFYGEYPYCEEDEDKDWEQVEKLYASYLAGAEETYLDD